MKHLSDLGLEDSGGRHRRLAVNFALIFTCVRLTYIFGLPTSSHSQATSISTPSCLNLLEKLGLEIPLGLPADVRRSLIPKDNFLTTERSLSARNSTSINGYLPTEWSVAAPAPTPRQRSPDSHLVGVGKGLKKGARKAPTVLNSMFNERSVYNVSAQGRADGIRQTLKILSG